MNGNTPYAGLPGEIQAGHRATADIPELSSDTRRALHRDASRIAARVRDLLPKEYIVDATISQGINGPTVTVAVHPPVGHPVSNQFTPTLDPSDADTIGTEQQHEVASALAASAALQVKQTLTDDVTPTAR